MESASLAFELERECLSETDIFIHQCTYMVNMGGES